MRYYITFAYPGEPAWTEQYGTEYQRYSVANAALADGCTIVRVWDEVNRLTLQSMNLRGVRSRRSFRMIRRLIAHGWLK